jgi:hypothetical protein
VPTLVSTKLDAGLFAETVSAEDVKTDEKTPLPVK